MHLAAFLCSYGYLEYAEYTHLSFLSFFFSPRKTGKDSQSGKKAINYVRTKTVMQITIDDYTRRVKFRYTWPKLSMRQKLLTGV